VLDSHSLQGGASTTFEPGGATIDVAVSSNDHRSMRTRAASGSEILALTGENLSMTRPARSSGTSRLRRVLLAPFTRRDRAEQGYAIVSFPIAIAG
jgi:hypothetical protein